MENYREMDTNLLPGLSNFDHCMILVGQEPGIFQLMKMEFEAAGFPFSMESGKEDEYMVSHTPFIGREYLELVQVKKNPVPSLPDSINLWEAKGIRGVVSIVLRTPDIDYIYRILEAKGVFVEKPDRETYVIRRQERSSPWRYLDLPPIDSLNLQIRWIQLDPMVENMMFSGLSPNSKKVNGVNRIESLVVSGPLTVYDWLFLEKIFPSLKEDRTSPIRLKNASLQFAESAIPSCELLAPTDQSYYFGRCVKLYNFSLKVTNIQSVGA